MPTLSRYETNLQKAANFRALILRLYDGGKGIAQAELARKYRVSRARISQIVNSGNGK
jgi:Mor family transcriptional regulator